MKASPCFAQQSYSADLQKISGLSEDMQKLWIDTKIKQLLIINPTNLSEIKTENLDIGIVDAMNRVREQIEPFKNICCSISGGSDSDIILDILARSTPRFKEIHFVFFDTGIEYQATKDHLNELERKYGITIERERAVKSIPHCCKEYGQPFLSKRVSELMSRLQRYGFKWEDKPIEELLAKYPQCKAGIRWWCNDFGDKSRFNIAYNKGLKEFLISNPPNFKISPKCCDYTKKRVAENYNKSHNIDLVITGVRKAEGGARATAYKSCFSEYDDVSQYRPIFWFKDESKEDYARACDVTHSECYTKYGMKRTGCAGCPFGRSMEDELKIIHDYEPKLELMVNKVFGDSYEYTSKYRKYVKEIG